jgi:adenine/guanine/hypoxanthine permease
MKARWFVRGDLDGFVGLFVDNLLQLLLIITLCPALCGIPLEVVAATILPGAALSVLIGNVFYTWQARRLAAKSGRDDVTALPYGINTVSLIAFIFLIMAPIWRETGDAGRVLEAGVFACLLSGVMEFAGAFLLDPLRRWAPRAALLSALAGVAITFIAMGFAFQIFASPAIALAPMVLIVVAYGSGLRLPLGIPAGLCAIALGVAVAWGLRALGMPSFEPSGIVHAGLYLPKPDLSGLGAFPASDFWKFLPVIFPMALFNVVGSLQSLESAEAAGDRYETRPSLAMNGIGSIVAGLFGSAFPTTIYIGHPGWKAMGARMGYSAVNGLVVGVLCFTGSAAAVLRVVPLEATLGILIWIGVVMAAQAFQETPKAHAVAVAVGLIPALAAWALMLIESALRAAGATLQETAPKFGGDLFIDGLIALNQGFLLTSMGLAAIVAFSIDRRFVAAAVSAFTMAGASATGLVHAFSLGPSGLEPKFGLMAAPAFAFGYTLVGTALLVVRFLPAQPPESTPRR